MVKKQNIGYKVVVKEQGNLVSANCDSMSFVVYKIGEKTVPRPKCGPLCLFSTLSKAKWFFESDIVSRNGNILKVKYKPSKKKCVWFTTTIGTKSSVNIDDLFDGTVLAESVTPLKILV